VAPIVLALCACRSAAAVPAIAGAARSPCGPGRFVAVHQGREPIVAWFAARSYEPEATATLVLRPRVSRLTVSVLRVAGSDWWSEMEPASTFRFDRPVRSVGIELGNWPSGLYFARVTTRLGTFFAPIILRPRPPGTNRVAVVLPTNTWAAYNLRDSDGNGYGDSWYADPRVRTVVLGRPFTHGGVPRQLGGFVGWLEDQGLNADFYSDEDLDTFTNGDRLASLYDLVVFAGHEEYVTQHVFAVTRRYRDLGGNLAFLSANNFFSRVRIRTGRMTCLGHFRRFGEPEAQLVGVEYVGWNRGVYRSRPYVVRSLSAAPWLFEGTGLRVGDRFGFSYGVEIDAVARSSPPETRVVAVIPSIFGRGRTAQMTYYQTPAGAKVFAAGAMNFDTPQSSATDKMLRNLWDYLSQP
jgi:hypothetical protein